MTTTVPANKTHKRLALLFSGLAGVGAYAGLHAAGGVLRDAPPLPVETRTLAEMISESRDMLAERGWSNLALQQATRLPAGDLYFTGEREDLPGLEFNLRAWCQPVAPCFEREAKTFWRDTRTMIDHIEEAQDLLIAHNLKSPVLIEYTESSGGGGSADFYALKEEQRGEKTVTLNLVVNVNCSLNRDCELPYYLRPAR